MCPFDQKEFLELKSKIEEINKIAQRNKVDVKQTLYWYRVMDEKHKRCVDTNKVHHFVMFQTMVGWGIFLCGLGVIASLFAVPLWFGVEWDDFIRLVHERFNLSELFDK